MLQQEHPEETREEQVAQLRTFAHPLAEAERLVSVRLSDDGPVVRALPDQCVAECSPTWLSLEGELSEGQCEKMDDAPAAERQICLHHSGQVRDLDIAQSRRV